ASIEREGPMTLGALADAEGVAPPTVTKLAERLGDLGFVARRPDAADRRVTRVEVTEAGHDFLQKHRARKDAWLATRLDELDAADLARLADAVPVLEAVLTGARR